MRNRHRSLTLWQEITLALVLKITLLTVIWLAWFAAPHDDAVDAMKAASHLFSSQAYKEQDHDAVAGTR